MKNIILALGLFLVLSAPGAYAQSQSQSQATNSSASGASSGSASAGDSLNEEDFDYAYELTMVGLSVNESCKPILDPKFYEGFKVLFRIQIGELGGTDEDAKVAEQGAVTMSNYLCDGHSECWRKVLELPATATVEEGRQHCFDTIKGVLADLHDVLAPEADTGS